MDEKTMQRVLEIGDMGGTPSEVRALEAAYRAGIATAIGVAETWCNDEHVLRKMNELLMDEVRKPVLSGDCGQQWGGGDIIHSCTLEKGHTGQCWWPGLSPRTSSASPAKK